MVKVGRTTNFSQNSSPNLSHEQRRTVAKVRAFGELVASLWARGDQPATVRPEHLWKIFAKRRRCLFSAPTCGPALPGMHPNRSVKSALHTRSLWQTDSSPDRSSRNVTLRKPVHPHALSVGKRFSG